MIAIPVESATPTIMSSKLFGNAPMFAIYEPQEEQYFIIRNSGEGNGMETAKFLKEQGVKSVLYTHLGEGLFNALHKDNINVYYLGKESISVTKIIENYFEDGFVKVEPENAKELLDPGTSSDNCQCGCDHG